jgi:hypothetical protein
MSNEIGVSGAGSAGEVAASVVKSEQQLKGEAAAAAHKAGRIAELQAEIASEQKAQELRAARAKALDERIAALQAQLQALIDAG